MTEARCTNCGANLEVEQGKKTTKCDYCQSTIIVSNALALAEVEVDHTKDLLKLRENLSTFVKKNSIDEILRASQKIKDLIPKDFSANYYFAYAKQQGNQPKFMYDFLDHPDEATDEELVQVIAHILKRSDLRDKPKVIGFLNQVNPEMVHEYNLAHAEREQLEDYYSNIPRDVFICHSSYDNAIAQKVVKELEKDGNTCWISTRNLRPEDSENYWNNIKNAIKSCSIFLVITSENSQRSKDVQREVEIAFEMNKPRFEYAIDDARRTSLFKHVFDGIKWVDGMNGSGNYAKLTERVFGVKQSLKSNLSPTNKKPVLPQRQNIRKSKFGLVSISIIVLAVIGYFGYSMLGNQSPTEIPVEPTTVNDTSDTVDTSTDTNNTTDTTTINNTNTSTNTQPDQTMYSIVFNDYDGSNYKTMNLTEGSQINIVEPTRPGYTFVKWYGSAGSFVAGDILTVGTKDIKLTAVYKLDPVQFTENHFEITDTTLTEMFALTNKYQELTWSEPKIWVSVLDDRWNLEYGGGWTGEVISAFESTYLMHDFHIWKLDTDFYDAFQQEYNTTDYRYGWLTNEVDLDETVLDTSTLRTEFPEFFYPKEDGYYFYDYGDEWLFQIVSVDSDLLYMLDNLVNGYDQTIPAQIYTLTVSKDVEVIVESTNDSSNNDFTVVNDTTENYYYIPATEREMYDRVNTLLEQPTYESWGNVAYDGTTFDSIIMKNGNFTPYSGLVDGWVNYYYNEGNPVNLLMIIDDLNSMDRFGATFLNEHPEFDVMDKDGYYLFVYEDYEIFFIRSINSSVTTMLSNLAELKGRNYPSNIVIDNTIDNAKRNQFTVYNMSLKETGLYFDESLGNWQMSALYTNTLNETVTYKSVIYYNMDKDGYYSIRNVVDLTTNFPGNDNRDGYYFYSGEGENFGNSHQNDGSLFMDLVVIGESTSGKPARGILRFTLGNPYAVETALDDTDATTAQYTMNADRVAIVSSDPTLVNSINQFYDVQATKYYHYDKYSDDLLTQYDIIIVFDALTNPSSALTNEFNELDNLGRIVTWDRAYRGNAIVLLTTWSTNDVALQYLNEMDQANVFDGLATVIGNN